jgi:hypothetical protein
VFLVGVLPNRQAHYKSVAICRSPSARGRDKPVTVARYGGAPVFETLSAAVTPPT